MLLNCNSCQKKFIVPDSAITQSGRLVQCGSCGSKWTQYPVKEILAKKTKIIKENKNYKNTVKKTRSKKNLYTAEYLKKKHGLVINESKDTSESVLAKGKKKKNSFGFYSYIIILLVFFASLFGVLNLTKEIIIFNFPKNEKYIVYLYETLNNIKTIFYNIVFNF